MYAISLSLRAAWGFWRRRGCRQPGGNGGKSRARRANVCAIADILILSRRRRWRRRHRCSGAGGRRARRRLLLASRRTNSAARNAHTYHPSHARKPPSSKSSSPPRYHLHRRVAHTREFFFFYHRARTHLYGKSHFITRLACIVIIWHRRHPRTWSRRFNDNCHK